MKIQSALLGDLGAKFFALMQMRDQEVIQLGELQSVLQITAKQERELLSRLARRGYIVRLIRGTYLVPKKLPPGGKWMPDEYVIIYELMKSVDASYQICGPLAFQRHGLSEQIPNIITIYNTKLTGRKTIGSLTLQLIKVDKSRIGAREKIVLNDKKIVYISSLARTIMDSIYEWSRFNTIPKAYDWIKENIEDTVVLSQFIDVTIKYSNVSTKRRVGYILEKVGVSNTYLKPILKQLPETKGWVILYPSFKARGVTNKKWRVIDNAGQPFNNSKSSQKFK